MASSNHQEPDALNAAALASINNKLLDTSATSTGSTSFPEVTLAGGEKVRTGTIATLLHNIRLYDASSDEAERKVLQEEMRLTIPVLRKVGMFDLFSPEEWVGGGKEKVSEARRLVGQMALGGK